MEKYGIDSHKLMHHVKRVNDWLDGKVVYPIYAELSPAGACNHRCVFCGLDFMKYQPRFLEKEMLNKRLSEMAELGMKSIMYGGEGEPFLHKDIGEIIVNTKDAGIDTAVTTNGVLFNEKVINKCLGSLSWVKVSITAATKETYAKLHGTKPEDFELVMKNLESAAKTRDENGYQTTLGVQILLLPENKDEVVQLAQKVKELGANYIVVKPYSQHLLSETRLYKNIKYADSMHLADKLEVLNDKNFNIIFRIHTMEKWDEGTHGYKRCLALPFWSYIDAGGGVWGCSCYLEDKRFYYGNLYENTFWEIWNSENRKVSLKWVENEMDVSKCRVNCRMDKINKYLWDLKHPSGHVNFI